MKRLSGYKDLQVGGIYNSVYVGENNAYARINGKTTFHVLETNPTLKCRELYSAHGSLFTDELTSNPITYSCPEVAFRDRELFEPTDESEWFKKSVKITSLAEALNQELITLDDIQNKRLWSNQFVSMGGDGGTIFGFYFTFSVEGKTRYPLLQYVYVFWKSWKEINEDFKKYNTEILS